MYYIYALTLVDHPPDCFTGIFQVIILTQNSALFLFVWKGEVCMRFYCVIQKCNLEKIKDFQSFREALPRDITFYPEAQKDKAIEAAKRLASGEHHNDSYIVTLDFNKLLKKQALAQINGPNISETIMPERKVDYWQIFKVSKNTSNEWKLEKMKEGRRAQSRGIGAIITSALVLGIGYFVGLGFWPVIGLITLSAITKVIVNRATDHYVKKYYKSVNQIKAIQNPSEIEAIWRGKESTNLLQEIFDFIKPVTWMHPLAYAAGKKHASNCNEKVLSVIDTLHRPKV